MEPRILCSKIQKLIPKDSSPHCELLLVPRELIIRKMKMKLGKSKPRLKPDSGNRGLALLRILLVVMRRIHNAIIMKWARLGSCQSGFGEVSALSYSIWHGKRGRQVSNLRLTASPHHLYLRTTEKHIATCRKRYDPNV